MGEKQSSVLAVKQAITMALCSATIAGANPPLSVVFLGRALTVVHQISSQREQMPNICL